MINVCYACWPVYENINHNNGNESNVALGNEGLPCRVLLDMGPLETCFLLTKLDKAGVPTLFITVARKGTLSGSVVNLGSDNGSQYSKTRTIPRLNRIPEEYRLVNFNARL